MVRQMTTDDIIAQKSALVDDLYASRNKWRDRCLIAESELESLRQCVDGASEAVETAKEDAEYWKARVATLEEKIIDLRKTKWTSTWTSAREAKPPHDTEVLLRTVEFAVWLEIEPNLGMWGPDGVIDSLTEWRHIEETDRQMDQCPFAITPPPAD